MHLTRPRLSLVAVVIMILLSLAACSSAPKKLTSEQRAHLHIQMAEADLKEGDPTGALQQATLAESLNPKNPMIYALKGLAFHTKNDLPSALKSLEFALHLAPEFTEAHNIYGKLLSDAGRFAEAETHLQKAAFNPLYREAYKAKTSLGIIYYRQEKNSRAIEILQQATLDAPQEACVAYYYLGHIHLKNKHFADSIKNYKKASDQNCAGFAEAHLALGMAYERNKNFDQARMKYLDVQKVFPNTPVSEQANERLRYIP